MEKVTEQRIRKRMNTAIFGKNLVVEPLLPSTNSTARQLAAEGAPEGTVVVADAQSAGRGRRGRGFFSPTGGVYLSVVLRPASGIDPGLITSCAAVAAARAIEQCCPARVGIKWVNDLFIGGRKVCGILTEGVPGIDGDLCYAVLGIGINVGETAFPPELHGIATSLQAEGYTVDRSALIACLLTEWERAYATLHTGDFLAESRRRSVVLGREVAVIRGQERFPATAMDINDHGHLLVKTPAGDTIELLSGEVSLQL